MTLCSTLLAIVAMPLLTWLYIGQTVPVPVVDMLFSILKIVLLPVVLGVVLNTLFKTRLDNLKPLFPFISSLSIIIIIAIIVALNHGKLAGMGGMIVMAVMLHNVLGLVGGYQLARLAGFPAVVCRTLAIEVGMQNSGLSVAWRSSTLPQRQPYRAPCSVSGITSRGHCWRGFGLGRKAKNLNK